MSTSIRNRRSSSEIIKIGGVARERFELSSAGPEPAMLGRYTTGLIIEISMINLTLSAVKSMVKQ
jgi:hypothetical protein